MISPGCLVYKGWNYKGRPILDTKSQIGIIISSPIQALMAVERLSKKGPQWDLDVQDEVTETVAVLWPDGLTKYHAVCNLVEVNKNG